MALKTGNSRNTNRIAASWAGVAAAVLATGLLTTTVVAGGTSDSGANPPAPNADPAYDDAYVSCMRSAGGSPDTLEHWIDACVAAAQAAEDRYLACMRDAIGTVDTLDRWVASCRERAVTQRP